MKASVFKHKTLTKLLDNTMHSFYHATPIFLKMDSNLLCLFIVNILKNLQTKIPTDTEMKLTFHCFHE